MMSDMVSIAARITALELAVIAVANQELGDSPGHPFRGNQYSGGGGKRDTVGEGRAIADHVVENARAAAAEYKQGVAGWTKDINAQMGDLSEYKHDPEGFADAITSTYGVPAMPIETGTDYAAVAVANDASHGAGLEPLAKFTEANGLDIYSDKYNELTNEGHNPQVIAWDTGTSGQGPDVHDLADTLYDFEKNT